MLSGCQSNDREHIDVLHKCAALLLEKERINRAEFEALFDSETASETEA